MEIILFSVNHPSQYHLFKNLAKKTMAIGYQPFFFIQDRGLIKQLVVNDGFRYQISSSDFLRKSLTGKYGVVLRGVLSLIQQEISIFFFCLRNNVKYLLGTDIAIAHVGWVLRKPSFLFTDDDYCFIKHYSHLAFPFAKHIIAAKEVDLNKWGNKRIAYAGNQKVSYLHPDYFYPSIQVLEKYGLSNKRFFIIRLVKFAALHDAINNIETGLEEKTLGKIINLLTKHGVVIISAEGSCPSRYKSFCISINPQDMHDLLYYADMLISDSQSMHIEAALLGVPAIRTNKWVAHNTPFSVIDTLEKAYGLGYSISPGDTDMLIKTIESLLNGKSKEDYLQKRTRFFAQNTNLTCFLFELLENYPSSLKLDYPSIAQNHIR